MPQRPLPSTVISKQQPSGLISSRVPLPPIHYRNSQSESQTFATTTPTLLVLWASWCPTCQAELRQLQSQANSLSKAGISILALSVDHLAHDAEGTEVDLQRIAREWGVSFPTGLAHESVPTIFEAVQRHIHDKNSAFQLPMSMLVMPDHHAAAFYPGKLAIPTLLEHALSFSNIDADTLDRKLESYIESTPDCIQSSIPYPARS